MKGEYKNNKVRKPYTQQIEEINTASAKQIVYDDDCPKLSLEDMKEMEKLANERRAAREKELISLRVDHESIEMAKSLGKGYTKLFSRLIYIGMRDPEILKQAL